MSDVPKPVPVAIRDGKPIWGRTKKNTKLSAGYCGTCHAERKAEGVMYPDDHPDHFGGISEFRCPVCGRREGRWTRKALADGEFEPKFGKRSD